jgi:hypothetical protein
MTQTPNNGDGVAAVNEPYVDGPKTVSGHLDRWLSRLAGQIRRQYLSRLRPGYVVQVRAQRQGECRQCGSCCDLTFHCPFLTCDQRCSHYEKRTRTCRDFPIDATDLRLTQVPCGHYYEVPAEGDRADSSD